MSPVLLDRHDCTSISVTLHYSRLENHGDYATRFFRKWTQSVSLLPSPPNLVRCEVLWRKKNLVNSAFLTSDFWRSLCSKKCSYYYPRDAKLNPFITSRHTITTEEYCSETIRASICQTSPYDPTSTFLTAIAYRPYYTMLSDRGRFWFWHWW